MIFMRSGKTGSGKSFDAIVKTAYPMWKKGLDVWSNTPLFFTDFKNGQGGENIIDNPEYFTIWEKCVEKIVFIWLVYVRKKDYCPLRRGTINYFETLDEIFHVKDAVIIFDEGQTAFRNYDWEHIPRMFLHKLEQNRKHGLHLITTAQRMKAVNINYRELVQDWSHFETILDIFGFHLFRTKIKDVDYITENLQEANIPNVKVKSWCLLTPFTKRLYDTMYDVGFEPLQEYQLNFDGKTINFILETGTTVKQALKDIKTYKLAIKNL